MDPNNPAVARLCLMLVEQNFGPIVHVRRVLLCAEKSGKRGETDRNQKRKGAFASQRRRRPESKAAFHRHVSSFNGMQAELERF